jgi:hypothetical protein
MCSTDCPCPTTADFSKWDETTLNSYGRTKNNKFGYRKMINVTIGATYSNFYDCYSYVSGRNTSVYINPYLL